MRKVNQNRNCLCTCSYNPSHATHTTSATPTHRWKKRVKDACKNQNQNNVISKSVTTHSYHSTHLHFPVAVSEHSAFSPHYRLFSPYHPLHQHPTLLRPDPSPALPLSTPLLPEDTIPLQHPSGVDAFSLPDSALGRDLCVVVPEAGMVLLEVAMELRGGGWTSPQMWSSRLRVRG